METIIKAHIHQEMLNWLSGWILYSNFSLTFRPASEEQRFSFGRKSCQTERSLLYCGECIVMSLPNVQKHWLWLRDSLSPLQPSSCLKKSVHMMTADLLVWEGTSCSFLIEVRAGKWRKPMTDSIAKISRTSSLVGDWWRAKGIFMVVSSIVTAWKNIAS